MAPSNLWIQVSDFPDWQMVAAGLAQGMSLRDAVLRARAYVRAAIASAPGLGSGHGPLNHAVTVDVGRLHAGG